MTRRYAALARISSREQEREGFSLDVQEDALRAYAERSGGEIVKLFRIAETASNREERKVFRELLTYCRRNARRLDAVLFYKVDRAARNLRDFVEVERLEEEHGVQLVFVSQPTENTPTGRMMRRDIQGLEVMIIIFDFRSFSDAESCVSKHFFYTFDGTGNRMQTSAAAVPARQCYINGFGSQTRI